MRLDGELSWLKNIVQNPHRFFVVYFPKMEIDDDDEDVILAIIRLSNEAAIPVGGLEILSKPALKRKSSKEGISSLALD